MNIQKEKAYKLSSQERYNIIADTIDYAEDDGFLNQFVASRAFYVCAARAYYPELTEKINTAILEGSPMIAWNMLLEDGTIEKLMKEYEEEIQALSDELMVWFEDYMAYRHSARGVIDILETFTGNMANNMVGQINAFKNDADISSVTEIANKWGMNNAG